MPRFKTGSWQYSPGENMKLYGGQNMYAHLRRVLVRRPDDAFGDADAAEWHYTAQPQLHAAQREHDRLVEVIKANNTEVLYHDADLPGKADAIYVFDPALITDQGAVLLSMGKQLRRGEETAIGKSFVRHGIPVIASLQGDARAECGDLLWIDERTLGLGIGFRTNRSGYNQLSEILGKQNIDVHAFELPYYYGPEACLHLLSMISILDERLAVIYPRLMPVPFWQFLNEKGFRFVEVPDEEFLTMGPNVLALGPRKCIMLEGNPVTKRRLEEAGCEVFTYTGNEISLKAEGGPTCLTRPVLRG